MLDGVWAGEEEGPPPPPGLQPLGGDARAWQAWAWASVEVLSTSSSSKVSESQKFSPYFTKDEVEAKEAGHSLGNLFVFFGFYENKLRTSWVG